MAAFIAAALALSACGSGGESTKSPETTSVAEGPSTSAASPSPAKAESSAKAESRSEETSASHPPTRIDEGRLRMSKAEIAALPPFRITAGAAKAPRKLIVTDIREGSGAAIHKGEVILVDFVGIPYSEAPKTVPLNQSFTKQFRWGNFIKGWLIGLPGMKIGGRRKLVVPARLGDAGTTMIYEVDLRAIEAPLLREELSPRLQRQFYR